MSKLNDLTIGNYVILARLGAGGMGTVYKAEHRRMKRVVAIKVLSKQVATSETFLQRFQREVEAVARLSHPNIVMAFDADESEAGHFLVMEYVDGQDLETTVRERGPLTVAGAVDCVIQAARALSYAHAQGIIHRDIKPANLLRDVRGVVKVADLGLARMNDSLGQATPETSGLTQAGTIMGTVDFMPPEQAMGLTNTDHRGDIYSLGCTLYYLLTGHAPYSGPTLMAILIQHRDGPIPNLCEVCKDAPAGLEQVFKRMVAKEPEQRYASMQEVIEALELLGFSAAGSGAREDRVSAATSADSAQTAVFEAGLLPSVGSTASLRATAQTIDLSSSAVAGNVATSVLLVEPSRTQLGIIRKYLQELGIKSIAAAASGAQALEAARVSPVSVIISAMHLPDMTGLALVDQIRTTSAFAGTGFVLITSQSDADHAHLAKQSQGVVLLSKPFDSAQLSHALRRASAGRPRPETPGAPRGPASLRVLVADDSSAARIQIRSVLTGLGVGHIVEVQDGAEARACLEKEPYDLVVTDYNMPRLDGRGLIDFIRHHSSNPDVPVILVTTETDPEKLDAVRQLGVSAMCDKSFKLEVVHAVMEKLR